MTVRESKARIFQAIPSQEEIDLSVRLKRLRPERTSPFRGCLVLAAETMPKLARLRLRAGPVEAEEPRTAGDDPDDRQRARETALRSYRETMNELGISGSAPQRVRFPYKG